MGAIVCFVAQRVTGLVPRLEAAGEWGDYWAVGLAEFAARRDEFGQGARTSSS